MCLKQFRLPRVVNPVESNLTVATNKRINDVNLSAAFTHTYVGDLSAWLITPYNDTLQLFEQPGDPAVQFGCNGRNGNLTFDDQAAQNAAALENQCNGVPPALSGTFQSIKPFSGLLGKSSMGQWKFVMGDNYPTEDGGSITAWSLSFCFPEAIAAGTLLANSPLNVTTAQSSAILQTNLNLQLSGTPGQAVYTLLTIPQHGTLSLNGTPLDLGGTFTQADLNNSLVVYANNGDGILTDDFHFDALDQNDDAWIHDVVFNINVLVNNLAASAAATNRNPAQMKAQARSPSAQQA